MARVSRPAPALQRLERILTMVPWLLDHPGTDVDEVTERFGVTREELASDLDILGYCGLPGYGGGDLVEASIVGDRVVVRMADFFRRPLRLSLREAVTLVLAARVLAGVSALPESGPLRRAEGKLVRVLGAAADAPRRADGLVEPAIAVDLSAPGDEHLPVLRDAISARRVVRLTYRSASKAEITERDVEPWALVGSLGAWYLQGYCRLVRAPRDFRLDRVRHLEVTEEVRASEPSAPPHAPAYQARPDDERVVLDLAPEAWWVAEQAVVDEVSDEGDNRRVVLRTPELDWAARLVLGVGPAVRVVEPPELTARVAELAEAQLARYRTGQSAT